MKCTQRWLRLLVAVALFATACTGGSTDVAETTTPIAEETPTEVPATAVPDEPPPTEVPTEVPEVVALSDDDRLAAAMAAFEANPQPQELFAYDILETSFAAGRARITICGWNGDTVFDQVRLIIYRVGETPGANGEPDVDFESASIGQGECLNSTLVESALQATRDYDNFWSEVAANPSLFDPDSAAEFLTEELLAITTPQVATWEADDVGFRNGHLDGALPASSVTDILVRTYPKAEGDVFELAACRPVPDGFGLYRGDVLVDDFRAGSPGGPHALVRYFLTRRDGSWRLFGVDERVWADCLGFQDGWLSGMDRLFADPVQWNEIDS